MFVLTLLKVFRKLILFVLQLFNVALVVVVVVLVILLLMLLLLLCEVRMVGLMMLVVVTGGVRVRMSA